MICITVKNILLSGSVITKVNWRVTLGGIRYSRPIRLKFELIMYSGRIRVLADRAQLSYKLHRGEFAALIRQLTDEHLFMQAVVDIITFPWSWHYWLLHTEASVPLQRSKINILS